MYEIIVDGPDGDIIRLEITRKKLSGMISRSIGIGVIASSKIEGEDIEGLIPCEIENLPEAMLVTPK